MRKIVLEPNVLISGIIACGPSARIVDAVQRGELLLVASADLLREFSEVVTRPHIARKYPQAAGHAETLLDFLRANAILVVGVPSKPVVLKDPDDDFLIACAEAGEAEYIVSGDPDLLEVGEYKNIRILSPREFVDNILR